MDSLLFTKNNNSNDDNIIKKLLLNQQMYQIFKFLPIINQYDSVIHEFVKKPKKGIKTFIEVPMTYNFCNNLKLYVKFNQRDIKSFYNINKLINFITLQINNTVIESLDGPSIDYALNDNNSNYIFDPNDYLVFPICFGLLNKNNGLLLNKMDNDTYIRITFEFTSEYDFEHSYCKLDCFSSYVNKSLPTNYNKSLYEITKLKYDSQTTETNIYGNNYDYFQFNGGEEYNLSKPEQKYRLNYNYYVSAIFFTLLDINNNIVTDEFFDSIQITLDNKNYNMQYSQIKNNSSHAGRGIIYYRYKKWKER